MENIFAFRLQAARKIACLSIRDLAEKINLSHQAISKYENAKMMPDSEVLISLSSALGVNVDYFFREPEIILNKIDFRKKSKLAKKEQERIKSVAIDYLERYLQLESILNINSEFSIHQNNTDIKNNADIENAANELRNIWSLGVNPISNIIGMLEDRNVKILQIDTDKDFDGLSAWVKNIPLIVVNKKLDLVRKRFTVLHELAHLLFNFSNAIENKDVEKLCHSFAGAFLIPENIIKREFGDKRTKVSLPELESVKNDFGISAQALMYRLLNLKIIDKNAHKSFSIFISRNNLRNEIGLGNYQGIEQSERFMQMLYHALSEKMISISKASELSSYSIEKLRNLVYKVA